MRLMSCLVTQIDQNKKIGKVLHCAGAHTHTHTYTHTHVHVCHYYHYHYHNHHTHTHTHTKKKKKTVQTGVSMICEKKKKKCCANTFIFSLSTWLKSFYNGKLRKTSVTSRPRRRVGAGFKHSSIKSCKLDHLTHRRSCFHQ